VSIVTEGPTFNLGNDHPKVQRAAELYRGLLTARVQNDMTLFSEEVTHVIRELGDTELLAAFIAVSAAIGRSLAYGWAHTADVTMEKLLPTLVQVIDERRDYL
jgi:hypothetical protein